MEKNETCSAYFFNLAKEVRGRKIIRGLKGEDGALQTGREQMMGIVSSFYRNLFKRREVDVEVGEGFLRDMEVRVPPEVRKELEQEWTVEELGGALKGMKPNRVPGADGLQAEFYRVFWGSLGPDLLEVAREVFKEGRMGELMREGVISLLFKKGEQEDLKNWRPVTLLGVDCKLWAKVLAGRLKKALPHVVAPEQTCGVVGRQLFWNLVLVRDAISWACDRRMPLMLVGLDQEKAFDRVSHQFLWRVLERLGFGPSFVRWVRVLYSGVGSRVNVNGHLSDLILQEAGVRQGCPMSPLLFVLYMEPFAVAVRREQAIRGLGLPGTGGREVKLAQYADDTTLLLRDERSLDRALEIVERFSRAAGAKLNVEKSVVKLVGEWKERREFMGGIRVSKGAIRILGVDFGGGNDGEVNWMKRIRKVRMKLGLWQKRRLSIAGKILVIKAEVLPALVFLARGVSSTAEVEEGGAERSVSFFVGGVRIRGEGGNGSASGEGREGGPRYRVEDGRVVLYMYMCDVGEAGAACGILFCKAVDGRESEVFGEVGQFSSKRGTAASLLQEGSTVGGTG